jgi:hypothetical protein
MLARIVHRVWFQVAIAAVFVLAMAVGYRYAGGLDFVQGWGGGIAAVIATFFLVFKSQGYWAWMIVNAALWTYLFFHAGLPMLAYLQISFLIFAGYGAVQWTLVRYRIGFNPRVRTDVIGSVIALAVLIVSLVIYWNQPGYPGHDLVVARARQRCAGDRCDVDGRLPLPRQLDRVDALELLLRAAVPARQAVGPVLDDLRVPGPERLRLDRLDARTARFARTAARC